MTADLIYPDDRPDPAARYRADLAGSLRDLSGPELAELLDGLPDPVKVDLIGQLAARPGLGQAPRDTWPAHPDTEFMRRLAPLTSLGTTSERVSAPPCGLRRRHLESVLAPARRRRGRCCRARWVPSSSSAVICMMRGFGSCSLGSRVPPLEEPSMRKQHVVVLSEAERARLHTLIGQGTAPARALTHARILLNANQGEAGPGWTDRVIAAALEVHHTTVARVRQQYASDGLDAAVDRKPPAREYRRKLDGAQEARLIALACSTPPEGHQRWTLRLLAERLVALEVVDDLSHETVRQALQQTGASRG
jgi:transposase